MAVSRNILVIPPRAHWSGVIPAGKSLKITDLEGQQAVDFLCYDADNPSDRYSATNTLKVQGNVFIGEGSVLYADGGNPLLTVETDTFGGHDTIYGCCSNPNNFLRYGVKTTESCYSNFTAALAERGLGKELIVSNINWFMRVPVLPNGDAGVADESADAGNYVVLKAHTNVLAVLSNCPQMHNPCNGYNPTPISVELLD